MNPVQELHFELMRKGSFNNFDGARVVNDLIRHAECWRSVTMVRHNFLPLLELEWGDYSADTLYILAQPGQENALEALAQEWDADDIVWIGGSEAEALVGMYSPEIRATDRYVLKVWWD